VSRAPISPEQADLLAEVVGARAPNLQQLVKAVLAGQLLSQDETEQLTDVLMSELLERERASDKEFTERGTRLDELVGIVSQYRRGFFD